LLTGHTTRHLTGIAVVDDDHEDEWAQLREYTIEQTVGDRVIGYRESKALARLKKLWQAREYWTDQRLCELYSKKRGSVNGKGPDHFKVCSSSASVQRDRFAPKTVSSSQEIKPY
jgi:hypothetical protein